MRAVIAAFVVVPACGRVGFDDRAATPPFDAATPCGTLVFDDEFAGSTIDTTVWSITMGSNMTVSQAGALNVDFGATVQPPQSAGITQVAVADIRGECLGTRVVAEPTAATFAYCDDGWIDPSNGQFGWATAGGMLEANYYDSAGEVTTNVATVPFDASVDLRAREDAGTYVWETSSDGVTFTQLATATIPTTTFDPTQASAYFVCAPDNNGSATLNAGHGTIAFVRVAR